MDRLKVMCCGYRGWAKEIFSWVISEAERLELRINFYTVDSVEAVESCFDLIGPDMALFYGWSWIVPERIVDSAKCWCLHPSKLPKYRGGSPLQHQIICGETESAVSIFRITEELDGGPLLAQIPFSFKGSLDDIIKRIVAIAKVWTVCSLITILSGEEIEEFPQEQVEISTFKRRGPEESEITLEEIRTQEARYIFNKVRALSHPDYPQAYIVCGDGVRLKILKAEVGDP